MIRLAIIVSHPIQYYVPLYQRLAKRDDIQVKVFFTWHGGDTAQLDHGFKKTVAWDIPLMGGYDFEIVPNSAKNPGTHHFWGVCNPTLVKTVLAWRPDAVHITGYSCASHLKAIQAFAWSEVPVLFRGDSHLLNERRAGLRWWLKRRTLSRIYSWPSAFLYVGTANKAYYQAFGVSETKLHYCPHSVEVERFAEPDAELEQQAAAWREELGLDQAQRVLLFAGKFEDRKRPVQLMKAMLDVPAQQVVLLMVGDGESGAQMKKLARMHPKRFRMLPFQNQSRMPLVYRLGDVFVLPSAHDETWGLAVNEALACGRPVLVSDRVGCSADVVVSGVTGEVFRSDDWSDFRSKLGVALAMDWRSNPAAIKETATRYSIPATEVHLVRALQSLQLLRNQGKLRKLCFHGP